MSEPPIYHVCRLEKWEAAQIAGAYGGSDDDARDGFIHFSTADQVEETAARHFADQTDLLLVAVDPAALGDALKYEPSRGGALFPHLYGDLSFDAVLWEKPLPIDGNGRHDFAGLLS